MTSVIVDSVTCPTVDTVEVLRVVGALVISGQLLLVARLLRVMLWMVRVLYLMNLLWMVCGRSEDCSQLLAYAVLILTMNQFTWRLPPRLDFQAALPVLKQYYNFENDISLSWSIFRTCQSKDALFIRCCAINGIRWMAPLVHCMVVHYDPLWYISVIFSKLKCISTNRSQKWKGYFHFSPKHWRC